MANWKFIPPVTLQRQIQPEILDSLHEDHPEVFKNLADLRVINALMGNDTWFRAQCRNHVSPACRVLEVGAGDGRLGRHLFRRRRLSPAQYTALDRFSRPLSWPGAANWLREDLRDFDRYADYDVLLANLILHQFSAAHLKHIGRRVQAGIRCIIASEPARHRLHPNLVMKMHLQLNQTKVILRQESLKLNK